LRVVLASRNAHKIEELARMAPHVEWVPLPAELGDPPETGDTFHANALEKAHFAQARLGGWALADDSGLEVDALGGRPGVYSRRYSAEATDAANNRKLLAELRGVTHRVARYRCVIALVGPGVEHVVEGACEGAIAEAPRGSAGFGYDPLFLPERAPGRTMAELAPHEKDGISHRGVAMRALLGLLERIG
jgi:XTP/dITP diphosphohydrolase